jgi:hypothetical protein
MIRRIWGKYDASIVLVGVALAAVGAVGGTLYVLNTYRVEEVGCTTETIALPPPTNQAIVLYAITVLVEAGVVPSAEFALEAYLDAQYVFDPQEHDLEYWLYLESGSGVIAVEFNFTCPLELENFPLDLEFEGVRGV